MDPHQQQQAPPAGASTAPRSDVPPEMRYGAYNEKEGYLAKKGNILRNNALFHLQNKVRYLVIRGSSLRCYKKQEDTQHEWELPLQNAQIAGRRDKLEIEIRAWDAVEEFVADDVASYDDWFAALKHASDKSIKDYYAFVRVLGEGHFGKVLLAKDRNTREKFAVKVIQKHHAELRSMTLIQRELAILRLVNHDNIVRLYDLFDTDDKLYFVLENMEGGALYQVLSADESHFSEERASLIIRDILTGLAYLHAKGIVHRDVKPENILTTAKQWPFVSKLADFGLSNFLGSTAQLESKVGTPYFCAREVVTNDPYGSKADMWSLGVVAFEMLSGRKPFEGSSTKTVLYAILDGRWTFPSPEFDGISQEAKHFIASLICIDVDRRMSAQDALNHPWIASQARSEPLPKRINSAPLQTPAPHPDDEEMEDDVDERN